MKEMFKKMMGSAPTAMEQSEQYSGVNALFETWMMYRFYVFLGIIVFGVLGIVFLVRKNRLSNLFLTLAIVAGMAALAIEGAHVLFKQYAHSTITSHVKGATRGATDTIFERFGQKK